MADIKNVKFGTVQVDRMYFGLDMVFEKPVIDTTAPTTSIRPIDTVNNPSNTYTTGQTVYFDVDEASDTYYTTDGTTPTTASTKYSGGIAINNTTTFKYFSVDKAGNIESVKTTTYTINVVVAPTTTISPSAVVQNSIPITITLTSSEAGAAIKYRIGSGSTVYSYTGPFTVNQSTPNVQNTAITIAYWSVGASATETEKTITYDTSGAIPSQPVVTVTNGVNQVKLDWGSTLNTTSYSVYRSTVAGTLGTVLLPSQYQTAITYTDTTAVAGTTYYYTVRAANYGQPTDSAQKTGVPTSAPTVASWRYLKIEGYGSVEEPATTRIIEFEAFEGTTNRMTGATILSGDTPNNAGTLAMIKDGVKGSTSNTYPLWWTVTPNAHVVIDLLAQRALTKLSYYSYSISGVQRANRFKILASNTNNGTDWVSIWDMSGNTTPQPLLPAGYDHTL